MAKGERAYVIQAAAKVLEMEDWLVFSPEPLAWKTVRQVAAGVGLSLDATYRQLQTLKYAKRVEQNEQGWRISPEGIIRHAIYMQDHLNQLADRYGLRRPGQ